MNTFECTYYFEELKIDIAGISAGCFDGEALLIGGDPDYPGEFFVDEIRIGGARLLRRDSRLASGPFEKELFKRIAEVLERDEFVEEFFAEQMEMPTAPKPYNTLNHRSQGLAYGAKL